MDPRHMRGVEQIVGHVEVIAIEQHRLAAIDAPSRIAPVIDLENQSRIRFFRFAHPYPEQSVTFGDRIRTNACNMRYLFSTGHARAGSGAVKSQAVIAAFDCVALDAAHGQRQLAVRACVFKRGHGTIRPAIEDDIFAKDSGGLQLVRDLMVPCGNVPTVSKKHGVLPSL